MGVFALHWGYLKELADCNLFPIKGFSSKQATQQTEFRQGNLKRVFSYAFMIVKDSG